MKTRDAVSLALNALGVVLLCFNAPALGFLLMVSGTLTSLIADALTGKQNNL